MNEELTCAELVERLTDLLESAVDGPTRQRLVDHLAGCEGCDTYFDQFMDITRSLGRLRLEPADGRSRVMQQVMTETFRRRAGSPSG